MGLECLLFTYAVGLVPLGYGLYVIVVGRIFLSSISKEPVRGRNARLLGCLTMLIGVAYYVMITWAWSFYDR